MKPIKNIFSNIKSMLFFSLVTNILIFNTTKAQVEVHALLDSKNVQNVQQNKLYDTIQIQKISNSSQYFALLLNKNNPGHPYYWDDISNYKINYTTDNGKTFEEINTDTIRLLVYKNTNNGGMTDLAILFMNDSIGFIYGTVRGYGYFPILCKTENRGKTWEWISSDPYRHLPCKSDAFLHKDNLFMFDNNKGIIFYEKNMRDNRINYILTNNGGKTWESKEILCKKNLFVDKIIFSKEGSVKINFSNFYPKQKRFLMKSNNYGESFKINIITNND